MIDLTELYVHWWAGRSQVQISDSLGIDRKTVRKYLAPAEEAGMVPGSAEMSPAAWRELIGLWWPATVDAGLRQVTWPVIEAHRDWIKQQLEAGVTQATVHQRLTCEHGLAASSASLRRWVAANLPEETRRGRAAQVRGLRAPAGPGSEAQIDYGKLGRWSDPATGKTVTVWAFVMVLACSRLMFVRPTIRMDQEAWTRAHVEAFAFFGGVPARLVPDNLKTGVDRPDLYDPQLNRSYAELAVHYDTLIDPARAAKPKDKPQVERAMPYVRDSFWRGRTFTHLPGMQAAAVEWSREVAAVRSHRGLDGAQPAAVFAAVEEAALKPLPRNGFTLAVWSTAKVCPDIHVKVGPALYSVPWTLIGQRVQARSTATSVQIVHDGQVVATHARTERGRRTNPDHYPPEKIAFHQRTPTWCRTTADGVGPACRAVIDALLVDNALYRLRSAQGLLGLRGKHGEAALEAACTRALDAGDPSYRTVKGILAVTAGEAAGDTAPPAPRGTVVGVPAFLHGQQALFAPSPAASSAAPVSASVSAPVSGSSAASASVSGPVVHLPSTSGVSATTQVAR